MCCSLRSINGAVIVCPLSAIRSSRPRHLDSLARRGVLFANHWANAAPCGPSRACLYTGTYQHRNRVVQNGTPLDSRFTNVARVARELGYDPVLFGHTDTAVDPRTVPPGDPRLSTYEGILPGFRSVLHDPWEEGSPGWGKWLVAQGFDVPDNPHALYEPMEGFPGSDEHGATWAPARFPSELSQTRYVSQAVTDWLEEHGDRPFFVHASFIRPHPPRRNPIGYHDLYDAEQIGPFAGCKRPDDEAAIHPFAGMVLEAPDVMAPRRGRGSSPAPGHVLRGPARGRRRPRATLRFPGGARPGRVDLGRGDERPRRNGR